MAQLAFAFAGAMIGAPYAGFLGMTGAQIGWIAGQMLYGALQPPVKQEGPKLGDLKVTTSAYGKCIPLTYGSCRVAGNVIWAADLVEHSETHDSGGGKGGGGGSSYTTYSYTCSFAVSLANNSISGVRKIWANGTLIYNISTISTLEELIASNSKANGFKIYTGSETQLPDPTIESYLGQGNVPAYRGQSYVVFTDLALADYGNRIPNLEFEVVGSGSSSLTQSDWYYKSTTPNNVERCNGFKFSSEGNRTKMFTSKYLGYVYGAGGYAVQVSLYEIVAGTGSRALIASTIIYAGSSFIPTITAITDSDNYDDDSIVCFDSDTTGRPFILTYKNGGWFVYALANVPSSLMGGRPTLTEDYAYLADNSYGICVYDRQNMAVSGSSVNIGGYGPGVFLSLSPLNYTKARIQVPNGYQYQCTTVDSGDYIYVGTWDIYNNYIHRYLKTTIVSTYGDVASGILTCSTYTYLRNSSGTNLCRATVGRGYEPGSVLYLQGSGYSPLTINKSLDFTNWNTVGSIPWDGTYYGVSDGAFYIEQKSPNLYYFSGTYGYANAVVMKYTIASQVVQINSVTADLCRRVGLPTNQVDASALTETLIGYAIGEQTTGRAAIETLANAFTFDVIESSGTVKFVKRGAA